MVISSSPQTRNNGNNYRHYVRALISFLPSNPTAGMQLARITDTLLSHARYKPRTKGQYVPFVENISRKTQPPSEHFLKWWREPAKADTEQLADDLYNCSRHTRVSPASMNAEFAMTHSSGTPVLAFSGDWTVATSPPGADRIIETIANNVTTTLSINIDGLSQWDALFVSRLYHCARWCRENGIEIQPDALTDNQRKLLQLALAVPPMVDRAPTSHWLTPLNPMPTLRKVFGEFNGIMRFIGNLVLATGRLVRGKATVNRHDFFYFIEGTGPNALAIVGLISILVGMILAYLGAVQLSLFGAEVYVANLVTVGMLREMGALMTAIIMAGRTGAAYAAQLGTMQANEEIDAIITLGIKPIDYLVLPRTIALLITMPLLCVYADVLGILGGVIVATGMDVSIAQFVAQARDASDTFTLLVGIGKSVVFALVIAIAGCKAGMESGRDSAAVSAATTHAVVTAIVWLVICDAMINISLSNLGI